MAPLQPWFPCVCLLAAACAGQLERSDAGRDSSPARGGQIPLAPGSADDPSLPVTASPVLVDAPVLDANAVHGDPSSNTTLPSSDALDHCRQPLPGITPIVEGSDTKYDESLLNSSQSFQISGSGEWDDNANYLRFLDMVAAAPVHETVNVSNRQFVVVVDRDGRGVGNCALELVDEAGTSALLTTLPSGRAAVFPELFGLEGPVSVTARCLSKTKRGTLSLEAVDEVLTLEIPARLNDDAEKTLDLAFVLDVTGSMAGEIEAMKETIDAVATEIVGTGEANVRLAIVAYRDYGDVPEFQTIDFTGDLDAFRSGVAGLRADGGGDTPEAVNEAMHLATRLDWDPEASARMAFVIADAPPHPNEDHSAVQSAAVLQCAGVKVFTVATTGQDPAGRFIFRQMSQLSSATHLFLLRVGAAPGSECADYEFQTGELHNLVVDRIEGELAAGEADPLAIPGLGGDRDTEISEELHDCADAASEATGEPLAPLAR